MFVDLNESGYDSPVKKSRSVKSSDSILIKDNVHGYIEVHPLCKEIINTPQFARLRSVKQLGCTHYVYPTGTHSRFDHCLGVMHLAGEFYNFLINSNPELFSEVDLLCVKVAGLIHDLGHGPFSHLWEQFVHEVHPDSGWTHEKASLDMFKYLIKENDIPLMEWQVGPRDVEFILELVFGPLGEDNKYKSRGLEKNFLFEIINNKRCGVDVDKMDYMRRDANAMGLVVSFELERYFRNAAIVWENGKSFISAGKGEADLAMLFTDRSKMHRVGYQHKTVKIIERMMLDVLLEADPVLDLVKKEDGGFVRLSQAHENPADYDVLSDDYVEKSIQHSRGKSLEKARDILERIHTRDLYKSLVSQEFREVPKTILKRCQFELDNMVKFEQGELKEGDLAVVILNINFGSEKTMEAAYFHNKARPGEHYTVTKEMIENLLPAETNTITVIVVCKKNDKELLKSAKLLSQEWMKKLEVQRGVEIKKDTRQYHSSEQF